ncbi:predicted aminopeptidase [Hahella chejuensis KCTC 2396]|uniref:Predicted aminopeptidase n=1 Tax=Hahella chejuensis (strain KCTC 2396) TaxID=349521 RepID=Q2SN61_HAHCH|nr:aminopeptidase [Hahella chejuensis]ABC27913.1 predicted aminopeptidase [Hahella chejuensis KCTC 2396]
MALLKKTFPLSPVIKLLPLLLMGLLVLGGCQSTGFMLQAIQGQWEILQKKRPIEEVVQEDATPPNLRERLEYVIQVREFAATSLHLPVEEAYSEYADLERPYVVWNVFAAPEFSMRSKTWCYPIAGCVAYQGYFAEQPAHEAAAELASEAFDTHVGGVPAYSTLGWFNDPVLNTFIWYDPVDLAGLLFHELAHRRLYIKGDTAFNESWATAVEQEGVHQYLQHTANTTSQNTPPLLSAYSADAINTRYAVRAQSREQFVALVKQTIGELEALYKEDISPEDKRARKTKIIEALRTRYAELAQQHKISSGYERWFNAPINNAKLLTVANYHQWTPGLRYKIRELNDLNAFYQWSESLTDLSKEERKEVLQELNELAQHPAASSCKSETDK